MKMRNYDEVLDDTVDCVRMQNDSSSNVFLVFIAVSCLCLLGDEQAGTGDLAADELATTTATTAGNEGSQIDASDPPPAPADTDHRPGDDDDDEAMEDLSLIHI